MSTILTITGKQLGSKKPLFPDRQIPYPPDLQRFGGRTTLRELITQIVLAEVATFRRRAEERGLLQVLTATQLAQGQQAGKIDPGGHELNQEVDDEEAVATALQAFEDGLYYIFIDGQQQRELDATVFVGPNSIITFVRLVALAEGEPC